MNDQIYMKRALALARRGEGKVSPNPMVGAVIVKNDRVIGEGYHRRFGGKHAEINAIESATEPLAGSDVYVTLEPCSHHGKTPPCVDRLIEILPARVIIGTGDPNPLVAGRGIEALRLQGINTTVGVLEGECRRLNEKFFTFMERKRPFVTIKFAQTIDGRIASFTGDSKWISSKASRKFAHQLRSFHDAVLVGIGTVIRDDPELTVRLVRGKNPIRVVMDSSLRIPSASLILANQDQAQTLIATSRRANPEKEARLRDEGIETFIVEEKEKGFIDVKELLFELGERGISSLLVEGGASVITSFLKARLADRLYVVTAPRILGKGIESVGDLGMKKIGQSINLEIDGLIKKGGDIIVNARMREEQ